MRHGYYAVDVFIVLSGFLLMSPVIRSGGRLSGGRRGFLKRRALRIFPAYLAAYAAFLLFWLAVSALMQRQGEQMNPWIQTQMATAYTWQSLTAHAFLLHNLAPEWICNGSNIFWTVAVEWQIYFLFILVLLPVWRRFGTVAATAVGIGLGLLPVVFESSIFYPVSWLIGLFALGAAGSVVAFSPEPVFAALRSKAPWGWMAAAFFGVSVALVWKFPWYYGSATSTDKAILETLAGTTSVCLILRIMKNYGGAGGDHARCLFGRCLELRPLLGLSAFSYSLYLMHDMVVSALNMTVWRLGLSPLTNLAVYFLCGVPAALALAYGFYLIFERPGFLARLGGARERAAAWLRPRRLPAGEYELPPAQ